MTVLIAALVALVVCALLVGVHRWLWVRLVRDTTAAGGLPRRIGTALTIALPLLSVAALTAGRAGAPFWLQQTVSWPGYLWLAVLLYLTLTMLVAEPIRALLLRRLAHRAPSGATAAPPAEQSAPGAGPARAAAAAAATGAGAEPGALLAADGAPVEPAVTEPAAPAPGGGLTRRTFVARAVGGAAAAVAVGTVAGGTYGVLRGPSVRRVQVPLAKLPRAAHGFRIAVVSDVHLGPVLGRAHAQRIVDTVNRTQPDLIAIVGDLVDGSVPDLGPAAEPLRGLTARHGSFFVTGNHEYFSGAEQWVEHVRELGLTPLENARRALPHFDLAGVNDIQGEREGSGPDFRAALGDRDRTRAAVLLAHQPVVIHDAVKHGVDLQLSGHTHGGQLWPGEYLAELANPTVAGLERYGDTQLYVSRGAGAWGPPVRVGAPSDITVVELASYRA
ncbi:metallophosphoesterase [Streptomyces yangpuensis]|uniref:Metallophosphoesterase n=1 Tax=Streptomyces yangpuensis TaxID=1648182 RepID=A0ABY5Q198_9ACTN|nr:metallophosphoesterase [Streptomyces yangpuensis]MBZ9597645.1 metallophosphoesterase [Streptomyces erythrochromogenes]UUY49443.1 metallophosphoesterase [Streptomyces yangpuensis]